MPPVHKLSAMGSLTTNKIDYPSMLAGNAAFIPSSYDSIATTTVGAGGAATVTFSSIPSTYQHLQVRFLARSNRASSLDIAGIYINSLVYYSQAHLINADGSTAVSNNTTGLTLIPAASASSNVFGAAVVDVLDYTNSNKNRVARSLNGFDNNGSGNVAFGSALWTTTNAISSLTVYPANGTAFTQYSSFALYGIKG